MNTLPAYSFRESVRAWRKEFAENPRVFRELSGGMLADLPPSGSAKPGQTGGRKAGDERCSGGVEERPSTGSSINLPWHRFRRAIVGSNLPA